MTGLLTTDVDEAAAALRAGGLVAFPTETVYGLGADAAQPHAVAAVYAAKGRPADHPLIVHLASADDLEAWARAVPPWALALVAACWPGPLTLVLPRGPRTGPHVTGGQPTVGVRVPDHPVALALLRASGTGVAAPSANRFGRVSPTTSAHVLAELGDVLRPGRDLVLEGGASRVGVESTILDATGDLPRLLRPGGVSAERIAELTGLPVGAPAGTVRAPGMLASHYAPRARVVVLDPADAAAPVDDALMVAAGDARAAMGGPGPTHGLLAPAEVPTPSGWVRLAAPADAEAYAAALYAALREADALELRTVVAVPPPPGGVGAAVRDRLARAAAGRT